MLTSPQLTAEWENNLTQIEMCIRDRHDVDTSMFFKWVFKAYVAVYLVTHTFDITMAVFDLSLIHI